MANKPKETNPLNSDLELDNPPQPTGVVIVEDQNVIAKTSPPPLAEPQQAHPHIDADPNAIHEIDPNKVHIEEVTQVFRRKPLIVNATQIHKKKKIQLPALGIAVTAEAGDWEVVEAGHKRLVRMKEFDDLYEIDIVGGDQALEAGLPDMDLGTVLDKDQRRMVRVEVKAGRGAIAYWDNHKPEGAPANWLVVADNVDNHMASHRAGRFIEPYEGKPGTRTWVILPPK